MKEKNQNSVNNTEASKDYFKSLEESILSKALGGAFHLPLDVKHPFVAPEGYFEAFDSNILAATSNNRFHLEADIAHPYAAPEGYLESLEERVLSATSSSFILEENINHTFLAPKGYFEKLDEQVYKKTINENIEPENPFKVIWKNYGNIIRVAATLIIVGFLGFNIYNNQQASTTDEELTLAELNTEAIYSYLEEENIGLEDFNTLENAFDDASFGESSTSETDELSEEELLQLIDFQFTDEI